MARKLRYFVPRGYYHVYARVGRGEFIFDDPVLVDHWLGTVKAIAKDFDLGILAYCLMRNHFHLVVRSGDIPLWRAMARLQVTTAKFHNMRQGVVGPLWQGRYKAKLVQRQEYLEQLFAYVHLNPVLAGVVDDPADYPLSGHSELIGQRRGRLVEIDEALRVFEEDVGLARARYLTVIRNLAEVGWLQSGVRQLPWWLPVINDHQIVTEDAAPKNAAQYDGSCLPEPLPAFNLDQFISRFEVCRNLIQGEVVCRRQTSRLTRERQLLILFLIQSTESGFRGRDFALKLGRNPSSVSRWLNQALMLNRNEPAFRADLDKLRGVFFTKE